MKKHFYFAAILVVISTPLLVLAATAPTVPAPSQPTGFIPLTNLPGLGIGGGSATLPAFLKSLYRLCIGGAAVFAIIQIMRGGFKSITDNESVLAKSEARSMISNAILGLVLVLSPYIVFSVINKDILNLDFTKDFAALQSTPLSPQNVDSTSAIGTGTDSALAAQLGLDKCTLYSGLQNVASSGKCSSDQVEVDPALKCCNVSDGQKCCATKASGQFLAAYSQLRTGGKPTSCTVGVIQYFGTQEECNGFIETTNKNYAYYHPVGGSKFIGTQGISYSTPVFTHSCDLVTNRSYAFPIDTSNPRCK
jgi:hypothetical protein